MKRWGFYPAIWNFETDIGNVDFKWWLYKFLKYLRSRNWMTYQKKYLQRRLESLSTHSRTIDLFTRRGKSHYSVVVSNPVHTLRKGLINVWFLVNRVPPRSCHRVNILTRGSLPTTNLKNRTKPDIVTPPPSKIPRKVCAGLNKSPERKNCVTDPTNFKQVARQQDKLRPAVGYKMMEVWVKIKRDPPRPFPQFEHFKECKILFFSEKRSIDIRTPESLRERWKVLVQLLLFNSRWACEAEDKLHVDKWLAVTGRDVPLGRRSLRAESSGWSISWATRDPRFFGPLPLRLIFCEKRLGGILLNLINIKIGLV